MARDWVARPELRNSEFDIYYWESPHKQFTENFMATVVKVHDGDTITINSTERDFDFPVRFLGTNSPELNERGGHEAQSWLESKILNKEVEIQIDKKQRVGKWGRLLGVVFSNGVNMNEESIRAGQATKFERRDEGKLPNMDKELNIKRWL